jgi:hypothetical protein
MSRVSMVLFMVAISACADQRPPDESADEQGLLSVTAGTLFSEGNFLGSSFTIMASSSGLNTDGNLPAGFDNIASSISVEPACTITLFTGPDQTGSSRAFNGATNLLPIGMDNAVSSYRADCVPSCPRGTRWCGPDQGCTRFLCE